MSIIAKDLMEQLKHAEARLNLVLEHITVSRDGTDLSVGVHIGGVAVGGGYAPARKSTAREREQYIKRIDRALHAREVWCRESTMKTRYYYTYDIFGGTGELLRRFCSTDKPTAEKATLRYFQQDAEWLMKQASYGNLVNPKYHAATWRYRGRLPEGLGTGETAINIPIRVAA